MGRGLSPLQQQILRLAWAREQTYPARRSPRQTLFAHEILAKVYAFPVTLGRYGYGRDRHGLASSNALHFQPGVIGPQRYHAAEVAVHRALGRLQARGLLTRRKGEWYSVGWGLTDQGRTMAQALMVDIDDKKM